MITIVGTGHVLDIGRQVRGIVKARRPAVVALELDPPRFQALQHPERRGRAPLVYRLMALVQRRIAEGYGGQAGAEMLAAADEGRSCGALVALIDRDAGQVFEDLKRRLPFREKVKLLWAMVGGLFLIGGKTVDEELERYQSNDAAYLEEFGKEFPTIKRILLDERNEHMARALRELDTKYDRVVAFVGDGHAPGISRLLADIGPEVVRLRELMKDIPATPGDASNGTSVTYTYEVKGES
jgi:pheromone shutdown protein TraB